MSAIHENLEKEIQDLKQDIRKFQNEKERVKKIIGSIGGVPSFDSRVSHIIFVILVVGCLVISVLSGGTLRITMIEIALALVSAKLIYMMHVQMRVNHFQLWILSSIEWRMNEIHQRLISQTK